MRKPKNIEIFMILVVIAAIAVLIWLALQESADAENSFWVVVGKNSLSKNQANIQYSKKGSSDYKYSNSLGASFTVNGNAVAYGKNLWVATGKDSGNSFRNILWSSNGIKWNESTGSSFAGKGRTVAYGTSSDNNPLWVAGGQGDSGTSHGNIMKSTDGKNWSLTSSTGASLDPNVYSVGYGLCSEDPLWVALGDTTNSRTLMWSHNGHDWNYSNGTQVTIDSEAGAVAYGTSNGTDKLWLAGSNDLVQSSDGKSWSTVSDNIPAMTIHSIVYGTDGKNPLWVAGGHVTNGLNYHYAIQWSTTGLCWNISSGSGFNVTDGKIRSISYKKLNNNKVLWVATGNCGSATTDDQLLYSTNGKNWLSYNKELFGGYSDGTEGGYGVASDQEKYPLP